MYLITFRVTILHPFCCKQTEKAKQLSPEQIIVLCEKEIDLAVGSYYRVQLTCTLMHTLVGQQQINSHLNWTLEISNVSIHLVHKTNCFFMDCNCIGGGARCDAVTRAVSQQL